MNALGLLPILFISVGLIRMEMAFSKVELLRRSDSHNKHQTFGGNSTLPHQGREGLHHLKPAYNYSEYLVPHNRTYEFLELYREMTAIKNAGSSSLKKAFIDGVLIPKTDAKVAKLKAETAYIETKNAAKKKRMNLVREDFEKSTPFTPLVAKLLNSTSTPSVNTTQILDTIYNETFYYLNNKNLTNSTQGTALEFS